MSVMEALTMLALLLVGIAVLIVAVHLVIEAALTWLEMGDD